jgi:His/Glu/Gln/Arg/opine family amino acid ABC transporter permease subunit
MTAARILPSLAVVCVLGYMLTFMVGNYQALLLKGAVVTVALALTSLTLATSLGLLGAWAKINGGLIARGIAAIYTFIIRGIPDIVLILLFYFGGQRLLNVTTDSLGLGTYELSKFAAGMLSIGLIYGAYLTETFRGAWLALPKGQGDAARALGLPPLLAFRKVLAPQLIRAVISGYSNVWQVLVKSTAVVSVIGLSDMVGIADKIGKSTRESFTYMTIVLLFYLTLTIISENGFKWLERRTDRWAS